MNSKIKISLKKEHQRQEIKFSDLIRILRNFYILKYVHVKKFIPLKM